MKFDRNGDGLVTIPELPAFARMPGVRGSVEKIFRSNDLSGDKALSREELTVRAETRFRELDTDRSGFLDAVEIRAGRRGAGR